MLAPVGPRPSASRLGRRTRRARNEMTPKTFRPANREFADFAAVSNQRLTASETKSPISFSLRCVSLRLVARPTRHAGPQPLSRKGEGTTRLRTNVEPCSRRAMALAAIRSDPADALNDAQRRAAENGGGPLLVIAGAGSGKTNTLAHRVAHLIVNGADPRRILLMTFSRRAAAEMTRRVERICAQRWAPRPAADRRARLGRHVPWDRRAAAARIRARGSASIPDFTIHDREDSADLMNSRAPRARLLARRKSASRPRGPASPSIPAPSTRELPLDEVLGRHFPWCAGWTSAAARAVRRLCRGQAGAERARLRRPAALLGADARRAGARGRNRRRGSTTCWSTNIRTPTASSPRSCWR